MTEPSHRKRATLSTHPNGSFSVLFRHPTVKDKTGKAGLRIRTRTTKSLKDADRLWSEFNELLSEPSLWHASAGPIAARKFDPRVIEAFYGPMKPELVDYQKLRDELLPLGTDRDKKIVLVGTTGSGKTTLLRQLLGTHPTRERFPATSAGRTTVAPTEIHVSDGEYQSVVTFLPQHVVREYVEECLISSVVAALRGESDERILFKVLHHFDQRFRLGHVIGYGKLPGVDEAGEDEDDQLDLDVDDPSGELEGPGDAWYQETAEVVGRVLNGVKQLATGLATKVKEEVQSASTNERVLEDSFEDDLGYDLSNNDTFGILVDQLLDEVERRFELLTQGELKQSVQGWPLLWQFRTSDRRLFLRTLSRFSSNHWSLFGQLLTPIVNGLRVRGPFKPDWLDETPHLVFIDGEGLGHTHETIASVPGELSELIQRVDRVCLVDNATQPMQAASMAALRHLVASGSSDKLILAFTHFDLMRADNLRSFEARRAHIMASVESALVALREQLGPFAERALRPSIEEATVFLGSIDRVLRSDLPSHQRTLSELQRVVALAQEPPPERYQGPVRPVYDLPQMALHVHAAASKFNDSWRARLGRNSLASVKKEHWARIKALTRRLSEGEDEYLFLRPAADLHSELHQEIYQALQKPVSWDGGLPDDTKKHRIVAPFAHAISSRLYDISKQRVLADRRSEWAKAYAQSGRGSSFVRAAIIDDDINRVAAPVPSAAPDPTSEQFLNEVMDAIRKAAEENDVRLR